MGHDTDKTKTQTQGQPNQATSQVGTHGNPDGATGTGQTGQWNDRAQREMQQGDRTRPAEPDGTSPLDKDQQPVNQTRSQNQNR